MFRLLYPWVLWFLILPILLWVWEKYRSRDVFLKFPLESRLSTIFRSWDGKAIALNSLPLYLALGLLIFALARPQWVKKETEVQSEGIDIILAIDASGSMAAMDFSLHGEAVNRLTVVKKVVTEFIKKQEGDRLGMVIFGDNAYTQCPLTLDYDVLIQLLDHIKVGIAGEGTAIGDGLALSLKRLKNVPGKSKVVILLTDGRNNSGKISPQKAAEIARSLGIKVYTIGIGTQGPVPFPQQTIFGTRMIYVHLDLDQETLEGIAKTTGGHYFFATDTHKLETIYDEIGRLEKTKAKIKHYQIAEELYVYFALAGIGLLILEAGLAATVLRRLG